MVFFKHVSYACHSRISITVLLNNPSQVCDLSGRGRQRQCAWEMFRFSPYQYSSLDWAHIMVCWIVPSVTVFMLQELVSLNQLKFSTKLSLR